MSSEFCPAVEEYIREKREKLAAMAESNLRKSIAKVVNRIGSAKSYPTRNYVYFVDWKYDFDDLKRVLEAIYERKVTIDSTAIDEWSPTKAHFTVDMTGPSN